jgi:hypothetical protein
MMSLARHLTLVLLSFRQPAEQVSERNVIFVGEGAELVAYRAVQADRGVTHTISIPHSMQDRLQGMHGW